MDLPGNKTIEEVFMNVNEEDLLGRTIVYVISADKKELENRSINRMHLKPNSDRWALVRQAEKEIPTDTTMIAMLWTTPQKKKRLFVLGENTIITEEHKIREMWESHAPH